jgi:hypothetical protein
VSEARDEDELSRRESTDNRKKGEFELLVLLAPRARLMSYVATMRYLLERIALGIIYSQLARASNCVFAPRLRTENQPDLDLSFMPLSLSLLVQIKYKNQNNDSREIFRGSGWLSSGLPRFPRKISRSLSPSTAARKASPMLSKSHEENCLQQRGESERANINESA